MSEKIKGMYGSKTRADEVLKWLIEQGAEPASVKLLGGDTCNTIYYVNKQKQATWVNAIHSELFNIVELPQWRAKKEQFYYYISDSCKVHWIEKYKIYWMIVDMNVVTTLKQRKKRSRMQKKSVKFLKANKYISEYNVVNFILNP